MVSQPAARNLHDGIADEECADDDAHLRGRKGEVLRNRRKREPDGGPVYIGYTEPYIEEEEYHVLVFTLILFQPNYLKSNYSRQIKQIFENLLFLFYF